MPRQTRRALAPVVFHEHRRAPGVDASVQTEKRRRWRLVLVRRRLPPLRPATSSLAMEHVASQLLSLCKESADEGARLTYVGRNERRETIVKLRAGSASSVAALQERLAALLPLARVGTSANLLDGSLQAHVTVPPEEEEWRRARVHVANTLLVRCVRFAAVALWAAAAATILWQGPNGEREV